MPCVNEEAETIPDRVRLIDEHDADVEIVEAEVVEAEAVDGLPVAVNSSSLSPTRWSEHPTVQAAAAAATGFVAGAATLALMRRYGLRRVARQVQDVSEVIDPAGNRWRVPPGPGHTYLVHVRVVTSPPPAAPPPE
jgi:hypothetical protein